MHAFNASTPSNKVLLPYLPTSPYHPLWNASPVIHLNILPQHTNTYYSYRFTWFHRTTHAVSNIYLFYLYRPASSKKPHTISQSVSRSKMQRSKAPQQTTATPLKPRQLHSTGDIILLRSALLPTLLIRTQHPHALMTYPLLMSEPAIA